MTSKRSRWLSSWLVVVLISLGLLSCSDPDGEVIVPNPGDDLDVGDLLDVPDAPLPDVSVDTGDATPAPTCDDGVQNGEETGIDCGGADCEACEPGQGCEGAGDCASGLCQDNVCVGAGCEGVSCDEGQACYRGQCYAACDESAECGAEERCFEGACTALSCDDVICGVAETCYRGVCYAACQDDSGCSEESAECVEGSCVVPTCDDGVQNGDESDVDCGGSSCEACEVGQQCGADADCGEALAQPWGDCQFEEGDVCTQAGVQTRMVEIFSCGEDGVCASEEIEEGQQCERVTEAEVCADEIFGEWSSCEALEGAEADLCTYEGERRRTVTSFACASESCEPTEREEVESCVRETDAVECGDTITGEWSSCEAVDGASVCALEGERRRQITTYSCAEGGCQETNNEEVESCALETDDLECGAEEVGEWGPCVGFDGTCSQTGTQTRVITSYACGSGECVPSEREETQSCSRDQGGVQCQEPDYGAWSECGGFADECALEGTRSRTVTYYECAADDSCAPREEVETGSCTRDTTGTSCGAGVTYGDWTSCDYATECSLSGERSRSVVTRTCAGGSCESVTTTETDTTECVRDTGGESCGDGVTRGEWSASCDYATECSLTGTRTRSVTTRTCAGGACQSVTTNETATRSDCARDTAGDSCGAGVTYGDWSSTCSYANTCSETGTRTRSVTTRTCSGGNCGSVTTTQTSTRSDCARDRSGVSCGTSTHTSWTPCGGFSNTCDTTGTKTRVRTDYDCSSGTCTTSTATETQGCTRVTNGNSCGSDSFSTWSACGGFANSCDETGTQTRTRTEYDCSGGSCSSSNFTETQSCSRDTDGDTCGSTTYGSWGSCGGFSSACDRTGTQSRTATDRKCSNGTCSTVNRTETQSCTRSVTGNSCGTSTYTGWGSCGGYANICDTTGTQSRTRTDYKCNSSGTCTTSTATETQGCTRSTNGNSCGTTVYGTYSACGGYSNSCDETGTKSRSVTTYSCSSGNCSSSTTTQTVGCSRNTDGKSCGTTSCGTWGMCMVNYGTCSGTQSRSCTDYKCSNGSCSTTTRTESQSCNANFGMNCTADNGWSGCCDFNGYCEPQGRPGEPQRICML